MLDRVQPADVSGSASGVERGFHVKLLALSFLVLVAEGYDMQVLAYAAPLIIRDLGIDRATMGPVFGAGLFGYMVGATALTAIADRIGHKRMVVLGMAWFGALTLLMAFAASVPQLLALRGLAGMGLGVAMPSIMALNAELSPPGQRSKRLTFLLVGYSLGASVGGMATAPLMARSGWEIAFYLGGIFPLVVALLLWLKLPESPHFQQRAAAGANDTTAVRRALPVIQLLSGQHALITLLLWPAFITSLLGHHLLTNWLPTILEGEGIAFQQAVIVGGMLMAGSIFGGPSIGALVDRYGPRALCVSYLLSIPLVSAIGVVHLSVPVLTVLVFLVGATLLGSQYALNAMAASVYPSEVRSSGAGWALGVGRLGAILGPLIGGTMLSAGVPSSRIFLFAAAPALICAMLVYLLARSTRNRQSTESLGN